MTFTRYGLPFQDSSSSLKNNAEYLADLQSAFPLPRTCNGCILGTCTVWALPRSLAATWGIVFTFFSSGYLDVSVHPVPSFVLRLHLSRLLHWEILGSMLDCSFSRLIAAYHVLLRLLLPRHPSCALNILTLCLLLDLTNLIVFLILTANSSLMKIAC